MANIYNGNGWGENPLWSRSSRYEQWLDDALNHRLSEVRRGMADVGARTTSVLAEEQEDKRKLLLLLED